VIEGIWPVYETAGSVVGRVCTVPITAVVGAPYITEESQRPVVANIKSQLKRIKTNEKSRQRNKATKSALKTSIRRFREAADSGDTAKATELAYAASVLSIRQPRRGSSIRIRPPIASRRLQPRQRIWRPPARRADQRLSLSRGT
jgi:ribosomal protein S20